MGRISANIANIFTLGNAFFGFLSIVSSIKGDYSNAAFLLFFAMILDGMDGRVARILESNSEFGVQLDSLADIVSFGVAPAVLMYSTSLNSIGRLGVIAAVAVVLAGIVRLARFNVLRGLTYFLGLPIPVVGAFLSALVYTNTAIAPKSVAILMLLLAYLMISKIRYPNFKQNVRSKNLVMFLLGFAILLAIIFIANPEKLIISIFLYYIIAGPVLEMRSGGASKSI